MPELPEIVALERFLAEHAVGAVVGRVDVAALSVLKTFDPSVTALSGRDVTGAGHWGKHLGLECDGLWLITHLSRGGWLRWLDEPSAAPPKPGKGPLALRVHFFTPEG
ncbi:DNA-formamidopyrimidine glycosylase family protein, partial [Nocardia gipuzkoensis]